MNIAETFRTGIAILLVGVSLTYLGRADEHGSPPNIVVRYCSGCHGVDGNGELPYMPRLAGQSATYLQHKIEVYRQADSEPVYRDFLRLFRRSDANGARTLTRNAIAQMAGVAKTISDDDSKAAAEWYSARPPQHGNIRNEDSFERGKTLFTNGAPDRQIPACQGCHGAEGLGNDKAPRLAGQHAQYIVAQLNQFRKDQADESPMPGIARKLQIEQTEAIAEYLESR